MGLRDVGRPGSVAVALSPDIPQQGKGQPAHSRRAGDVWYPQPAPADHPWRTMPHHGMTPHVSGTTLSAQARYAAGTREILESFLEGRPIRDEYLIVESGRLAGAGAHSYSAGAKH
jgi:formate dehydrogenase